ncbi:MAG: peptidylprolyl isomerase [Chlorobi bacterium]|nr:peptidylprolyl isomerase [Chlorobiota bacterium]
MRTIKILSVVIAVVFVSAYCTDENQRRHPRVTRQMLMNVNKKLVDKDAAKIKKYADSLGLSMQTTKTGLWYMIKKEGEGEKAKKGRVVTLEYKVSLLDGTECYNSENDGLKVFEVGHGGVESGLEEGVLMLNKGAEAVFILPPYLAHGLLGDENKIPARSSIVYEVKVLSIE